jgi:hypothetical protein
MHQDIARNRALIAPMSRIPEELLQEISIRYFPTRHNVVMSVTLTPLILGGVCSQWRSVSISTPRLWSSIHITVTEGSAAWTWGERRALAVEDETFHIEAVQAWLNRSGVLPLSISLFHPTSYLTEDGEQQLISRFLGFSNRWRHVTLLASAGAFPLVAGLSKEDVPFLETFFFHDIINNLPTQFDINQCYVFLAPRIRVVSSSSPITIPKSMEWSQLTSLSLECQGHGILHLTTTMALEILRGCQKLLDCTLDIGWSAVHPSDNQDVTVPLLRNFVIRKGPRITKSFMTIFISHPSLTLNSHPHFRILLTVISPI